MPFLRISRILSKDFLRNAPSPTDRASSIIRRSASILVAMEKASRICMPLEYVLTGSWICSPTAANSRIAGKRWSNSARDTPSVDALRKIFSIPVNSGLKPAPNSRIAATRPFNSMSPVLGLMVSLTNCRSVDLPAPLTPTIPSASPGLSSKLTSWSATKSRPNIRFGGKKNCQSRSIGF